MIKGKIKRFKGADCDGFASNLRQEPLWVTIPLRKNQMSQGVLSKHI
jgi:hypothetical protein